MNARIFLEYGLKGGGYSAVELVGDVVTRERTLRVFLMHIIRRKTSSTSEGLLTSIIGSWGGGLDGWGLRNGKHALNIEGAPRDRMRVVGMKVLPFRRT